MRLAGHPPGWHLVGAVFFALLSWSAGAAGQSTEAVSGLHLLWDAPDGCDARDAALLSVGRLVGPLGPATVPVQAHARVTSRASGGWRLQLTFAGPDGERMRELDAQTCDELREAAALILALAVNPSLGESVVQSVDEAGAAPKRATSISTLPPTGAAPPPKGAPMPTPARGRDGSSANRTSWGLSLAAGPIWAQGAIPSPAFGGAGLVAASQNRVRIELGCFYMVQRFQHAEGRPTSGGYIGLTGGAVSGCYVLWRHKAIDAGGCAQIEVGVIHGQGVGLDHMQSGEYLWLATGLSGLLSFELDARVRLAIEPSIMAPWSRPEFVAGGAFVYRPAEVTGSVRSLIELRFF